MLVWSITSADLTQPEGQGSSFKHSPFPVLLPGAVPHCSPWSWWSLAPTSLAHLPPERLIPWWLGTAAQLWESELVVPGHTELHPAGGAHTNALILLASPGGAYRRTSFKPELIQSCISYCDLLCWGWTSLGGCHSTKTITATAERATNWSSSVPCFSSEPYLAPFNLFAEFHIKSTCIFCPWHRHHKATL